MKNHNFIAITRDFGFGPIQDYDPTCNQHPLYAFKMALSTVWQYFIFEEVISTIAS